LVKNRLKREIVTYSRASTRAVDSSSQEEEAEKAARIVEYRKQAEQAEAAMEAAKQRVLEAWLPDCTTSIERSAVRLLAARAADREGRKHQIKYFRPQDRIRA